MIGRILSTSKLILYLTLMGLIALCVEGSPAKPSQDRPHTSFPPRLVLF